MSDPVARKGTPKKLVALIGFMGAGKSSVGRRLAERLGLPFIDLDDVIVAKAEKSITHIFRDHGEVGFRARERAALRDLLAKEEPVVLATGGGTFADRTMREWLLEQARTVYLEATPDVLAARLARAEQRSKRPLLSGPDPVATIRRLLAERTDAYCTSELRVSTDLSSVDQVAEDIARMLQAAPKAKRAALEAPPEVAPEAAPLLRIPSSAGTYPVELHEEAGQWIADVIAGAAKGSRVAIVTDQTVLDLHVSNIRRDLSLLGKDVSVHAVAPGEHSKSLTTVAELYDALLERQLSRADVVVAVGGGVVGDLAGFVASTLLRGVAFVQVPTTTLAVVDSSVGGKTGVNTARGKNLVGTFYPPKAVLVAVSHLRTLPARQHAAGLAEALKIAATCDVALFDDIVSHAQGLLAFEAAPLLRVLSRCIALKGEVVGRDEREEGERAVLNFGHTLGHAIESGESYQVLHGEAVALGMVAESELAEVHGKARGIAAKLTEALTALGLPVNWTERRLDVAALGLDKKRTANGVRMPVVEAIGSYRMGEVALAELVAFVSSRSSA